MELSIKYKKAFSDYNKQFSFETEVREIANAYKAKPACYRDRANVADKSKEQQQQQKISQICEAPFLLTNKLVQ